MKRLLLFLIESNIFISLGAFMVTMATQIELGGHPQWHPYLFLIFFATFFEYNFHRLMTILRYPSTMYEGKHAWVGRNKKTFFLIVALSALGFLIALFDAKHIVLISLLPIAVLTLLYSFPGKGNWLHKIRLRDLPYLKIFVIAFVWAVATVGLPVIQSEQQFDRLQVLLVFMERFLFVLAITIPFDTRDLQVDRQAGILTLPMLLGEAKAHSLGNILLLLALIVCSFRCVVAGDFFVLSGYALSTLLTILFYNLKSTRTSSFYHYGYLDGSLIVQGICLISVGFF